jgi:hypothetical protein
MVASVQEAGLRKDELKIKKPQGPIQGALAVR